MWRFAGSLGPAFDDDGGHTRPDQEASDCHPERTVHILARQL